MAPETTDNSTDTADLSEDVLYDALSNKRRRYALHYLKQADDPVSVQDLAEQVAAWENDKTVAALTAQERKRVYIALYQSHLSTMDDEGLIHYDEDAGTVEISDSMKSLNLYLEVVPQESIPWSSYYAGLALANALVIGLAWLEVWPFSVVPDLAWAGVVLVSFGASAFVQLYHTRQMRIGDEGPPPDFQAE